MKNEIEGFNNLFDVIQMKSTGWHFIENGETGECAFLPLARTSESEWEADCKTMMAQQLTINLSSRLTDTIENRDRYIRRGD